MISKDQAITQLIDASEELIRGTIDLGNVFADVCDFIENNLQSIQNADSENFQKLMKKVLDVSEAFKLKTNDIEKVIEEAKKVLE
jgi:hypothetical protein